MIILRKEFSKVSRDRRITAIDPENPRNWKQHKQHSSHDSGPGWSESESSEEYSEEREYSVGTRLAKAAIKYAEDPSTLKNSKPNRQTSRPNQTTIGGC